MNDPTSDISASSATEHDVTQRDTTVAAQLRTRVVREASRETWMVVNEGDSEIATIPLDLRGDATLRRADVNGELAEFSSDLEHALVRPRHTLRPGASTIVVLHYR